VGREGPFLKMRQNEGETLTNGESHHYWGGGFHCSSPTKIIHNDKMQMREANYSPTPSSSSNGQWSSASGSSVRDSMGRNIYIGLEDFYKLHGE